MDGRYRIIQGGMRAGKTFAILQYLISLAEQTHNKTITVCSNTLPALRYGALKDFRHILRETKHYIYFEENKTTHTFTCVTGTKIEFVGLDDDLKARGASRDILFVNEANRISWNVFEQLAMRTSNIIFLDYNPSSQFWVHDKLVGQPDVSFEIFTYLDNEEIPATIKKDIESHDRNSNWWRVYGLGEIGELEGNIFKGWNWIEQLPKEHRLLGYGLDFGFRPDPCAFTALYQTDDRQIIWECWYEYELTPEQIINKVKNTIEPDTLVIADNARPEIIQQAQQYGINMLPCIKQEKIGGDHIGVQGQLELMAEQRFDAHGENLYREYISYQYKESRDGRFTSKIPDDNNHLIDSARYIWYYMRRHSIIENMMSTLLEEYQ